MRDITINIAIDKSTELLWMASVDSPALGKSGMGSFAWPPPSALLADVDAWLRGVDESAPVELGKALFEHIFQGRARDTLREVLVASRAAESTAILLKSYDATVLGLPFEVLHDGKDFVVSGNRIMVREVNDGTGLVLSAEIPRRVLGILSEPNGQEPWGHDEFGRELANLFSGYDIAYVPLLHATPDRVLEALRAAAKRGECYDLIVVVAHGAGPTATEDGRFFLEPDSSALDGVLRSSPFSSAISAHPGCLVMLISCKSAAAGYANPWASVAQRVIGDGRAGCVIAMQRVVTIVNGLAICRNLVRSLRERTRPMDAFRYGVAASLGSWEHGTPCFYLRTPDARNDLSPDSETVQTVSTLLAAPAPGDSTFAICLPSFINGYSASEFREEWGRVEPGRGQYRYQGLTYSRMDMICATFLLELISQIVPAREFERRVTLMPEANLRDAMNERRYTHWFFLGSRSQSWAKPLLVRFRSDFELAYGAAWTIVDRHTGRSYSTPDPSQIHAREAKGSDYALIEKIVDEENEKVVFFLAGLWDSGTQATGQYLFNQRQKLVAEFGRGGFQLLLRLAAGSTEVQNVEVHRRPGLRALKP